ncbi:MULTISPECIES: D-aminoacyl-tRNA deacylase [Anaerococcus]|uniref:D-aminoacyl-tRNA deacylase n=1 Tax=Anaerococcus octavius TaxID=54007 RepID=A0A2I1M9V9_9FIRM|nr:MULTISPECIES: D-aminoacyl-tRNA deacylase [Anaerococcus]MBS6105728.1 D-tyrosyl-tRNA(Tyr) deacylase [Anaerococcus sp.]MDU0894731.1 D-aminoacyl-tRNA deacylase [Anaerococcus sp.]MDU2598474.1 D-aminoacyl-tRNA deacylase [Anaerococcus sp.]MDU4025396.1 D-aminoacyl-tRNA deacylase [Anaerococcus sp.]MDU5535093.1 D-aminoacyl-tRNA deacylase [Anaerococcus sp.]
MRAVIQQVKNANVVVNNEEISKIDKGFLVLLGIKDNDTMDDLAYVKKKIEKLRIFEDEDGKMNLSIEDVGGKILLVSQFTLFGDVRKGNRPSFIQAARPEKANEFYEIMKKELINDGFDVKTGKFQTHMEVGLINDGPTTILIDSERIL